MLFTFIITLLHFEFNIFIFFLKTSDYFKIISLHWKNPSLYSHLVSFLYHKVSFSFQSPQETYTIIKPDFDSDGVLTPPES